VIIGAVEDTIIAACKTALGRSVRAVESLPSGLTIGELEQRMRAAPAVYVSFLGGAFKEEAEAVLDARFGVFFLGQTGGDERVARLGAPGQIGAYEMFERAIPAIQGLKTPWGCLWARDMNNLFSEEIDRRGLALYSASFALPVTLNTYADQPPFETAFLQYRDDLDIVSDPLPVPSDQTIAQDSVQIPQSS